MGMKIDSVDKHTPSTTSETVRTSAWTNNGGKVNTLDPSLRNILIGLSIGQMVMIVVSVATLGSFVNSNLKEIEALKQTTGRMQTKINMPDANPGTVADQHYSDVNDTNWGEVMSKLAYIQRRYDRGVLELSNNLTKQEGQTTACKTRLTELEMDMTDLKYNDTILENHATRITDLEKDIANVGDDIQTLGAATEHLKLSNAEDKDIIQNLNTTIGLLNLNISTIEDKVNMHATKVEQLALERALDRAAMQNLNESIVHLEISNTNDQVVIQNIIENITNLDYLESLTRADIETLNTSIANIKVNNEQDREDVLDLVTTVTEMALNRSVDRTAIDTLNRNISQLQVDFKVQNQALTNQNLALLNINEEVGTNTQSIRNISNILSILDAERDEDIAAIEDNNEKLALLGIDLNRTSEYQNDLEARISYLEEFSVLRSLTVDCPANWLSYGSSCYALIDTPLVWTTAGETCRTLNAELVSIENAAEYSFLNNTLMTLHAEDGNNSNQTYEPPHGKTTICICKNKGADQLQNCFDNRNVDTSMP